jgi:hypothetical protein
MMTNSNAEPVTQDGNVDKKMTPRERIDFLTEAFALLIEPGQIVELRVLEAKRYSTERPHIESGFFDSDHPRDLVVAAMRITENAKGCYFTLNPLNHDLLARRCNRIDYAKGGDAAKDTDVLRRRWLLVDADPVRDPLISATDEEKAKAHDTILQVREHLRGQSWPDPILADSGNGYHLLYKVELPTDDGGLVERILRALAARFDSEWVKIDQSVFNPSRICKLPGTWARKGDHLPNRPHRLAKLLEVPGL